MTAQASGGAAGADGYSWTVTKNGAAFASGSGALATDVPNAVNAAVLQGSAIFNVPVNFNNGFLGLAASHTTGAAARAGVKPT